MCHFGFLSGPLMNDQSEEVAISYMVIYHVSYL